MQIDTTSYKSPNHSPRRNRPISLLVIHATVGSARSSLDWLCAPKSKVSIHYLITKLGKIYQLVPDHLSAWHAGKSRWRNLSATDIALGSIGIELENRNDDRDPYPPAQMAALLELSRLLVKKYRIPAEMVVRHLDIATPKGRKTDPAGFQWSKFMRDLYTADTPDQPRSYRVRLDTQIGATVRAKPSATAERVMALSAGTIVQGRIVAGGTVTLPGFGTSNQWLQLTTDSYVWLPLLETIAQS
jgi:N-acetyl-anhydromuramyl-L-alanine amidase AmpD